MAKRPRWHDGRHWTRLLSLGAVATSSLALILWTAGWFSLFVEAVWRLTLPLALAGAAGSGIVAWRATGKQRQRLIGLTAAAALAALVPLTRTLFFARAGEAPGGPRVDIVTYNLLFKGGNPSASVELLERRRADIFVFQEVTPAWADRLRALLEGTHPHRAVRPHGGTHGLAIFSRRVMGDAFYLSNRRGLPVAQCAPFFGGDTSFVLCNVHLASPAGAVEQSDELVSELEQNAEARQLQWREMMALVRDRHPELGARVIVAGDLNTLEVEPLYEEIRRDFVDVFRATSWGLGATFPSLVSMPPWPLFRIDYVFSTPSIEPLAAEVLPAAGSDHLALRAVVRVPLRSP